MNKAAHTYHTPASALLNEPEQPGALYYGVVRKHEWHEVACIREEDDGWLLVSGPTFYGRVRAADFVRDADDDPGDAGAGEPPIVTEWQGEIL
jgi:hypothetical protein